VNSPAFQFYPKDFLTDEIVVCMSNEQVGVYIRMLCMDWLNHGLPADDATLCRVFQCDEQTLNICLTTFAENDGRVFNRRLDKERTKQQKRRAKMSKAGKASGKARRMKSLQHEQAFSERSPHVEQNGNSSSSSSTTTAVDKKTSTKKFVKPTLEQVAEYCKERNNKINSIVFWNFYETKGWVVGKSPMKNWKSAIVQWEQRDKDKDRSLPQAHRNEDDIDYSDGIKPQGEW